MWWGTGTVEAHSGRSGLTASQWAGEGEGKGEAKRGRGQVGERPSGGEAKSGRGQERERGQYEWDPFSSFIIFIKERGTGGLVVSKGS